MNESSGTLQRPTPRRSCSPELSPPTLRSAPTGEIFREMGDLGLLGPTVPEKYGGAGTAEPNSLVYASSQTQHLSGRH
jgi:alkylation response protein AidB-like acyl-CoA dehydrogenase